MVASFSNRAPSLPSSLTSLVGREGERLALLGFLSSGVRLLTVTGPGGVGKTRLAIEVARDMAIKHPDGVRFVALASISDPDLVVPAIAQALDVHEAGSVPIFDRLVARLRERDWLLVLDNLEQVIGVAPRLAALLAACPRLTLLTTSRAPLHISGEQEYPIPPLALPDTAGGGSLAAIGASEAVDLFVQRARAIRPDFELTADNAPAVAAICARLDGLPLAIELAAARIRLLPPHGLLARLDHRLALLTGGPSDLPERQQTLRGTIAWSYDLLDPAEQRLFRRLSVFAGGCTLEAATTVVLDPGDDEFALLDHLTALIERSLLVQSVDIEGGPRYQMLATIREFAREELERSGEADTIRERHAGWCLELARWNYNRVLSAESGRCVARVESELNNLRTALTWSIDGDRADIAHGLVTWIAQFWYLRGYLSEGLQWTRRARAVHGVASAALRLGAAGMEGYLLWAQGQYARAAELLDRVIVEPSMRESPVVLANMLIVRGLVAEDERDFERAERWISHAVELFGACHEPVFAGYGLAALGVVAYHQGDHERAARLFEQALEIERELDNPYGIGLVSINLARLARDRGDYPGAIDLYRESLTLRVEHGGLVGIPGCLRGLASIASACAQPEYATRLYAAAEALSDAIGSPVPLPARARYERALARLRESLGDERFAAVWAEGHALTVEQAMALALDGDDLPGVSSPANVPAPGGLTARELGVLRLVAEGRTDREIAETLYISVRTVSTHVTNILNKLDVGSRSAAAAWAARNGLA